MVSFDPRYFYSMLSLRHLSLIQFKNYLNQSFDFSQRIVGISGRNGLGKTNLLDAIYYLCFTKSYFTKSDQVNVLQGRSGFRIAGEFILDEEEMQTVCILRENGKKEFLLNGQPYERFSQHIGKYPCVFIEPDDIRLITEGGEERRKYLDALISQLDNDYLQQLIIYNKILQQRNSQLKAFAERRYIDYDLLDVLDEQLCKPGNLIYQGRTTFVKELIPSIQLFYKRISGESYNVEITYESQLQEGQFEEMLRESREKDLVSQRTNVGPHRDDVLIALNASPFKSIASQGQRKSLLFAMKLAEFQALKIHKGFSPLLMMDDVFEKLDEYRMHNLLDFVCCQNDGQIFLTDTHNDRLNHALAYLEQSYQIIQL